LAPLKCHFPPDLAEIVPGKKDHAEKRLTNATCGTLYRQTKHGIFSGEQKMSGLLFLISVAGFVLIAYWAFRNDAMQVDACGSGLLAMTPAAAEKPKPAPKWKKAKSPQLPRLLGRREKVKAAPGWRRTLLYGSAR
jgi:hypothetical protein